ncbi:putative glutamine amidotransferase-like protein YfeJ [Sterolibacterium denitrificans]|uniref:Glutamine amidotransferase-like protein YfeJ n=1 Tax=Sterolibacterium denitrificans TaxID=157592 RepID=A0A7Z7HRJ7_9PROT|nr:glutamine amidotransferase [Sterolibacterium denitrificans]SMB26905.1 putative glutamine amidotransferase-like protein YfeJ [Sterolibacterium denitrificans]
MNVHFVEHEAFEAPGAFTAWVNERGHTASHSRVYAHEPLPTAIAAIDLLVILGGPQSTTTTREECAHFDAAAECALIAACIAAGKAVVGVCLGAQLLGKALGAPHESSPAKEIGKFPIQLTAAGKTHPMCAHFGDGLEVGHWHSDMPGLTPQSRILARSAGCPRQIIEYGELAYGLQCHLEFTAETIEGMIIATPPAEFAAAASGFVQTPEMLRAHDYGPMNRKLFEFLDRLMAAYALRREPA